MAAGWMRADLRRPGRRLKAPGEGNRSQQRLATNAGKYGALANDTGQVELHWDVKPGNGGGETFVMSWRERGGPVVTVPSRAGFGSTILSWVAKKSFDTQVELIYAPTGLLWRLQCAAKEIIDGSCTA